jgi:Fe2+ transport system protein FeoA
MVEVNLNNLNRGAVGYVSHVGGNFQIKRHLQNAGFMPGAKIVVLNVTPYNSSYLIDIAGKVKNFKKMAVSLVKVTV